MKYFLTLVLLSRILSAAEKIENVFETDHKFVSPAGYAVAKLTWSISEDNAKELWLSLADRCDKGVASIVLPAEPEGSYNLEAARLVPGNNTVTLCAGARDMRALKTLTLVRDDAVPVIEFEPAPGEFSNPPLVSFKRHASVETIVTAIGKEPRFATPAAAGSGTLFREPIVLPAEGAVIHAVARSYAGVVTPAISGAYKLDKRLTGWYERSFLLGYEYLRTLGSVKGYLPSGQGVSLGLRYGLDGVFNPNGKEFSERPFYIPGLYAQFQVLEFSGERYSESILSMNAGPEWCLALNKAKTLFLLTGASPGISSVTVRGPLGKVSGVVINLQAYAGIEWFLTRVGFFARARYVWFADETSPLQGVGFSAGSMIRL